MPHFSVVPFQHAIAYVQSPFWHSPSRRKRSAVPASLPIATTEPTISGHQYNFCYQRPQGTIHNTVRATSQHRNKYKAQLTRE